LLFELHQDNLTGIFYFIDPKLSKNKKFYTEELIRLEKAFDIELHLLYGKDFFDYFEHSNLWEEYVEWIKKWKDELSDFPEINFDLVPHDSFEEVNYYRLEVDSFVCRMKFD